MLLKKMQGLDKIGGSTPDDCTTVGQDRAKESVLKFDGDVQEEWFRTTGTESVTSIFNYYHCKRFPQVC